MRSYGPIALQDGTAGLQTLCPLRLQDLPSACAKNEIEDRIGFLEAPGVDQSRGRHR